MNKGIFEGSNSLAPAAPTFQLSFQIYEISSRLFRLFPFRIPWKTKEEKEREGEGGNKKTTPPPSPLPVSYPLVIYPNFYVPATTSSLLLSPRERKKRGEEEGIVL